MVNDMRTKSRKKKPTKLKETEDAAAVIRQFKEIIKSKKRNIAWLAYQQGSVFEKFKENSKFIEMVKQFRVSEPVIIFKINIICLLVNY